jgi:carbohydrate kinase (thermoresistant glucokinase family)
VNATPFVVIMGVSGVGKTSVGSALAERLGWPFYDADTFHPQANVAKMARGEPLDDDDRAPWLAALRDLIADHLRADRSGVLACSALKQRYRDTLASAGDGVAFVYLRGSPELIETRMREREDHYMKAGMLASQFAALEPPEGVLTVGVEGSVEAVVEAVVTGLGLTA